MATIEHRNVRLTVSRALGHVVIALHGELDVTSAPTLRRLIFSLVEEEGSDDVVLDLAPLEFIDSTALGALLYARRVLTDRGGTLTLSSPRPSVRRALETSGLGDAFVITAT